MAGTRILQTKCTSLRRQALTSLAHAILAFRALVPLLLGAMPMEAGAGDVPENTTQPVPGQTDPDPKATKLDRKTTNLWERDALAGDWGGVRTVLQNAGITFGLLDQNEVWGNLTGGLRRGVVYDGLTTASLNIDLGTLVCWPCATFFISAFQVHGRGPSANLVGNQQLVSNIEATRDIKLYDLWIEQKLFGDRLSIRIGQEGANDEMMITKYGALFLNSSFGFPGLPAADLPSGGPNYPMATPFARVSYQPNGRITLTGAIYNGDPAPPGTGDPQLRDAGGTAFRLNDDALIFGEAWYSISQDPNAKGLPGTYKIGVWYSSSRFPDQRRDKAGLSLANPASSGVPREHSGGFAVYGIVDQMIWQEPDSKDGGIGLFLLAMGAPQSYNLSNLYVEGGFNWKRLFHGRENDIFGFGVAYLGISPSTRGFGNDVIFFTGSGSHYSRNETVLEATYYFKVSSWLSLQPDVQYVINPGAGIPSASSQRPLKNAFVIGIRTAVQF